MAGGEEGYVSGATLYTMPNLVGPDGKYRIILDGLLVTVEKNEYHAIINSLSRASTHMSMDVAMARDDMLRAQRHARFAWKVAATTLGVFAFYVAMDFLARMVS